VVGEPLHRRLHLGLHPPDLHLHPELLDQAPVLALAAPCPGLPARRLRAVPPAVPADPAVVRAARPLARRRRDRPRDPDAGHRHDLQQLLTRKEEPSWPLHQLSSDTSASSAACSAISVVPSTRRSRRWPTRSRPSGASGPTSPTGSSSSRPTSSATASSSRCFARH